MCEQTGWSDRRNVCAELTTPALRATPPLRGGEFVSLFTHIIPDVRNDVFRGRAGLKNSRHAGFFQFRNILIRDDASDDDQNIVEAFFLHEFGDAGTKRHVRSRQYGESYDVGIFLQSRVDDLFGSLPQAGIDDFESRIAKGPSDDFCAAVVSIEFGLGNDDANLLIHQNAGYSYTP